MTTNAANRETIDDSRDRLYRYFDGAANRWFVYDGDRLIAEMNASGTALARYVFDPGTGEPLLWYDGSTRRYLHADERGSIVAITDGSGAATNINSYDEYGIPGASNTGRFQYTGQVWLPEVGLAYHRARFYSPTLGRFMQTDPIGFGGGINLYAYVGTIR